MATPNRIVLVHDGRRIFDRTGVRIDVIAQDDGETLKVFVADLPKIEKADAVERHQRRFARSLRRIWSG